jgi:hypothetical protein
MYVSTIMGTPTVPTLYPSQDSSVELNVRFRGVTSGPALPDLDVSIYAGASSCAPLGSRPDIGEADLSCAIALRPDKGAAGANVVLSSRDGTPAAGASAIIGEPRTRSTSNRSETTTFDIRTDSGGLSMVYELIPLQYIMKIIVWRI